MSENNDARSSGEVERNQVGLRVDYNADAEPDEVTLFHNTFGMMKFDVEGSTAVQDPEWDRLGTGNLKDGYERWITTGDVLYSVLQLPFIEEIDGSKVVEKYRKTTQEEDQANAD